MTDEKKNRLPESYEEFFALVGYAITQWADVDRLLFELCRFALNVSDRKTAIIFYRSQSIKEHLILTNSLLSESLSSMNYKRWQSIFKKTDTLLPFRNHIAHNPYVGNEIGKPSPERNDFWLSIETDPKKLILKPQSAMFTKKGDLIDHLQSMGALLKDFYDLKRDLPRRPLDRPLKPLKRATRKGSGPTNRKKLPGLIKRRSPPQSS